MVQGLRGDRLASLAFAAAAFLVGTSALRQQESEARITKVTNASDLDPTAWTTGIKPRSPFPQRQVTTPAEEEGWSREKSNWMDKVLRTSRSQRRMLRKAIRDDEPDDTFLPKNRSGYSDDSSSFWRRLCNATNASSTFNYSYAPLDDWNVRNATTCPESEMLPGDPFTNETEAYYACGALCGAIYDVGCKRQTYRLCRIGAMEMSEFTTTTTTTFGPSAPAAAEVEPTITVLARRSAVPAPAPAAGVAAAPMATIALPVTPAMPETPMASGAPVGVMAGPEGTGCLRLRLPNQGLPMPPPTRPKEGPFWKKFCEGAPWRADPWHLGVDAAAPAPR